MGRLKDVKIGLRGEIRLAGRLFLGNAGIMHTNQGHGWGYAVQQLRSATER